MTYPIIDFLEARLTEDEAAAMAAGGDEWRLERDYWLITDAEGGPVVYDESKPNEGQAAHIARHDPARVLREVAARRAILAAYRPTGNDPHPGEPCTESIEHDPQGLEWEDAQNWAPCERHVKAMQERRGKPFASEHILRYLAAAWSDHPDYRKEWAA